MSIDTNTKIQPFQVFDYNILGTTIPSIASQYSFVWGSATSKASVWRSANASIDTAYYILSSTDSGTFGNQNATQTLAWWQANHPTWILYQSDGVTPADEIAGVVRLDFSNAAVQAWQISTYVTPAAATGNYTFMAADNVSLINSHNAYGVYPNATAGNPHAAPFTQLYTGSSTTVDNAYVTAVKNWCTAFASAVHSAGLKLCVNLYAGSGTPSVSFTDTNVVAIQGAVDAILDEQGFTNFGSGPAAAGTISPRLNFMDAVQQANKGYYLIHILPDSSAASLEYAFACYLAGKEHNCSIYITPKVSGSAVYGQPEWYAQYGLSIGAPTTTRFTVVAGTGYQRLYANQVSRPFANMAVFLTDFASGTATWTPPAGNYVDLQGNLYTGTPSLTVHPAQGHVLVPYALLARRRTGIFPSTTRRGA